MPHPVEAVHDFHESLQKSHKASDLPLWEEIYRSAFPNYQAMIDHRQDGEHQRAGIDRSVILANSKQILIDEKIRGRNKITGKVYEDIALEYVSNTSNRSPGWVCKPLRADYIAYAIAPLGIAYLLPVAQLQSAWSINGDEWKQRFPRVESRNKGYSTISVGIPVNTLFPAIGKQLRLQFSPCEAPNE